MSERPRDLVRYPFPLDDTRFAYLWLPSPLTQHEAERLCQMIRSLVEVGSLGEDRD